MADKKKKLPKALEKNLWQKGKSGNPEGARAHNPMIKALRKITIEEYRKAIELVMTGNIEELKLLALSKTESALQVGIATSFLSAIKNGDYGVIERIAERIIGKIPEQININSNNVNANTHTVIDRVALKKAAEELEDEF